MPLTPSLAGQPADYVQWQLVYFRRGARKSEVMGPIA
jgi:cytochrome c553